MRSAPLVEAIRAIDDPYPYFRGLIADIGFEPARVPFTQPRRRRGISTQNWYTLYDYAFLGIVNHSKIPLRIATILGFLLACVSLCVALGYLIYKLLYWDSFSLGVAPVFPQARAYARAGAKVIGVLGFRNRNVMFWEDKFLGVCDELIVCTDDGSAGEQGRVTGPFEQLLPWSDQVFTCGPTPMFEAMHGVVAKSGLRKPVQALMEERMACGMGICYSCAVFPRKGGVKLCCTDGPMFDLRDLY